MFSLLVVTLFTDEGILTPCAKSVTTKRLELLVVTLLEDEGQVVLVTPYPT